MGRNFFQRLFNIQEDEIIVKINSVNLKREISYHDLGEKEKKFVDDYISSKDPYIRMSNLGNLKFSMGNLFDFGNNHYSVGIYTKNKKGKLETIK